MATDIYSMLTGGYDPRAEQMKQQQLFQQQLSQSTTPQSFISTVGTNMGNALGQGIQKIAGVQDPREEKSRIIKQAMEESKGETDPVKRLRAVAQRLRDANLEAEAMQIEDKAEEYATTAEGRAAKKAKAEADAAKVKTEAELVTTRSEVLKEKFPEWTDEKIKAVASDQKQFASFVAPPKEYAPSDYAKILIESGLTKDSEEFKVKMKEYGRLTTESKSRGNSAEIQQAKLAQAQLQVVLAQQKIDQRKADIANAGQKNRLNLMASEYNTNKMVSNVDELTPLLNKWTTGWGAKLLDDLPTSDAKFVKQQIITLRANIGFDKLQQMRDASPTGVALGQVSERELRDLQAVLASLDTLQTPEQLKRSLKAIKEHYLKFVEFQKKSVDAGEPITGTPEHTAYMASRQGVDAGASNSGTAERPPLSSFTKKP